MMLKMSCFPKNEEDLNQLRGILKEWRGFNCYEDHLNNEMGHFELQRRIFNSPEY
jgi:hypothetical protein